jgi:hypothetical protein
MVGQELHLDERRLEAKYFAPGYGEFFSGGGRTYEANALAVPVDALNQPLPGDLATMTDDAGRLFDAARSRDWTTASKAADGMGAAWDRFRSGGVPPRLGAQMGDALRAVAGAIRARKPLMAAQDALNVINAALDLQLRYRSPAQVDLARFGLWARQLLLDAGARNEAAVTGDVATLDWIRDRFTLGRDAAVNVDDLLRLLGAAADAGQLGAVKSGASRLRDAIAGIARAG